MESEDNEDTAVPEGTAYYNDMAYAQAIKAYLKKEEKLTDSDKLRLAKSYAKTKQSSQSATWFKGVITDESTPSDILSYAQVLQQSGMLADAVEQYRAYAKRLRTSAANNSGYVFNSNVVNESRFDQHDIQIFNESKINTEELEFSPSFFNNDIVYVTTNPTIAKGNDLDPWINENFMGLQISSINEEGYLNQPLLFSDKISTQYHEGPVAFNSNGEEIFFTRNSYQNGSKELSADKVLKLKIYHSKKSRGDWSDPKPINFATSENQECHPTLSHDGHTMIFASDREGTLGKMDLFISYREGSTWSVPENLGTKLNTPGNELFPFLSTDGTLYFASDTHDGLGGLDMFVSEKISDNEWSAPKNLGTPFNSMADDFGYIIDQKSRKGYFTSSRSGGFGKDDIYGFELKANPFDNNEVVICTQDSLTDQYLQASLLEMSILNGDNPEESTLTTLENGCVRVKVDPDKMYRIFATNNTYHSREAIFTKETHGNTWNIKLTTDLSGKFTQCLPCGNDFDITADKTNFLQGMTMISTVGTDCSTDALLTTQIPMGMIMEDKGTFTSEELVVGELIVLDNIYYDFDESYIKDEEQVDLDKLVNTMLRYPGLIVEMGSHTDSRGTAAYNQSLSERRAYSAMEYLTDRGIESSRIIPVGYGETLLRNTCSDGNKCSEDEHLFNRRTEIRILENNETEIAIQYQDNLPSSYTDIDDQVRFVGEDDTQVQHQTIDTSEKYDNTGSTFSGNDQQDARLGIGLYVGSYQSLSNAEKKQQKLFDLGYGNVSILNADSNGNHRVIIDQIMNASEITTLKNELLEHGIQAVTRYE